MYIQDKKIYHVQGQIIQTNPMCMSRAKYFLIILCSGSNISCSGSNISWLQVKIYHVQVEICQIWITYITFKVEYFKRHSICLSWVKYICISSFGWNCFPCTVFSSQKLQCIYLFKEILVYSSRHKHQIGYSSNSMSVIFKGF